MISLHKEMVVLLMRCGLWLERMENKTKLSLIENHIADLYFGKLNPVH